LRALVFLPARTQATNLVENNGGARLPSYFWLAAKATHVARRVQSIGGAERSAVVLPLWANNAVRRGAELA